MKNAPVRSAIGSLKRVLIIGSGGSGKTVVFLDLPRRVCLWRVLRRRLRYLGRERPDLPPGCRERLTWEFLAWIWTYRARRRGDILRRLAALAGRKRVAIRRSSAAIEDFLK